MQSRKSIMKKRIFRTTKSIAAMLTICAAVSIPCLAETFVMKDGSSMEGRLVHFFDGVATVDLESGERIKLEAAKINRIDYSPVAKTTDKTEKPTTKEKLTAEEKSPFDVATKVEPKSEKSFEEKLKTISPKHFRTPKTTFKHWRVSLLSGDLEGMASCFVKSAQKLMLDKLQSIPEDRRLTMIEQTRATKFKMSRPKIRGTRATMSVRRKLNSQKVSEVYSFQLEDGGWKIIPK